MDILSHAVLNNANARIEKDYLGATVVRGNPTESACINFLLKKGVDGFNEIQKKQGNELQRIPFSSSRKRQSIAMKHPTDPGMVRIISQGAPDFVLKQTTRYLDSTGDIVQFDSSME